MKKTSIFVVLLLITTLAGGAPAPKAKFPSLDEQLKKAKVVPGSALDKLIRANQDFSKLKDRDATDPIVPPWLKVYWQKGHPEGSYDNPDDPTGGYPHVLKEILEWMETHQDLKPGNPDHSMAPGRNFGDVDADAEEPSGRNPRTKARLSSQAATAGTNVRTSGLQSASRSESDIRINYWNPSKIIAGSNNIGGSGQQGMYWSSDGGVTWGQTTLPLASGDSFHSDPTVDWSSDGTAWSTTMGINGSVLKIQSYRSTDGGATWIFDGTVSGTHTSTDKQMQWIDHSASSPYANHNYVIWHNGPPAYMNRRTSSGWGTPIKVSGTETTGTAIGSDVKTNSAGDVFGFWPDTGSRGIYAVKSTNGGASYGAPTRIVTTYDSYDIGVPAFNNRRVLIYVSGGAYRNGTTNNVYALWADLSGNTGCTTASNEPGSNVSSTCKTRIWFSRSTDGGATWSARVKINDQSGLNDQFNPFLAVDETNGNIGAIYYDTVNDAGRKKVDIFYQLSTNGGASWEAPVKVTTAMTDETVTGADSGNQFGDYNSLSGYGNAFFPSWTDRRNNAKEEIWTAKITTSSTTTYAISGSAGVSGATVSAGSASATSDASNNYSISGLAAGTYTVTPSKSGCTFSPSSSSVTITSANVTANFTASCGSGDTQLTSGVAVTGQSVAQGAWKYYYITVPTGATNLTFTTTSATGDVDIYTQFNAKPTASSYICRPYTASGDETCSATNPSAGTWWLGVYGYAAGSYTVTGTVTTSSSTTLFSNAMDSSTGWASVDTSGTAGTWSFVSSGTFPTLSPRSGAAMAKFNSYDAASGSQTRLYRTSGFAVPSSATTATLKFWMYHDTGYSASNDRVQVQVSTGSTWANVGTAVSRYDGSTGWKQHTIDLTSYKGTTVQLGFLGISAYGNNMYVEDVTVTTP